MTLYKGRHMIGMNQKRNEQGEMTSEWEAGQPNSEASLEYEIADFGTNSEYDADGWHEVVWAKLRKVH